MPIEDPVRRTAESIHKIMLFMMFRVPPEKRSNFLSRVRGKAKLMNPVEMSQKKVPINSTIGQAISLTKNILNGLNPQFTAKVLEELMLILSQYKGEKKAMLKSANVDVIIEPFDSLVQGAVRKITLKDPKMLENVTKIIVHRGLGGGKLGYVESGIGKDPNAIHLFKTPILEQARRQGGGISGRELEEAFERSIVEVIGHEAGHIHSGGPNKPFGDEYAAGKASEKAISKMFQADDKPISKRDLKHRPISMRQNALDREDVGWGDNSGGSLQYFDPTLEQEVPDKGESAEYNIDNMAGGEANSASGAYSGGSYYGAFAIPVANTGMMG